MTESASPSSPHIPVQPNYFWHWVLIILPVVAGLYLVPYFSRAPIRTEVASKMDAGTANWYFILKMPEVPTTDNVAVLAAQRQFEGWLDALKQGGYQPMFLSDVLDRKNKNMLLPEKTVVLLFDPGYRATYEALNPIFESRQIPAVWLTHSEQLKRYDLRYVSRHLLDQMHMSGAWDVALYKDTEPGFNVNKTGSSTTFPNLIWSKDTNWQAKNMFMDEGGAHRLAVRTHWTPEDFLDQLSVEVPLKAPAHLFGRMVNGRLKGLNQAVNNSGDSTSSETPTFDLSVDPQKRLKSLFWPSTQGIHDFTLDLSINKLEGEFWLFVRSNDQTRQTIRLGFSKDLITVESGDHGRGKQMAFHSITWPVGRPFSCKITALGDELKIQPYGGNVFSVKADMFLASPYEKFGIMVYDRVRGSAEAKNISLTFAPLPQN